MYPTNIYTQHTCVLKSCPSTQSGQYVGLVLGTPSSAHSASPATHTFRHVTPGSTHFESSESGNRATHKKKNLDSVCNWVQKSSDTQEIEPPNASFCVQSSHVTWVMWCHICDKRVKSDSANSRGMLTDVARHKWWDVGLMRCRALLRDYRALWWQCRAPLWRYRTLSRQCRAVLRRRTQTKVARHKWNEIFQGSIHVHIPRLWFVNMPSNINAHTRARTWTHPQTRGMK